ncbi:MAG: RluA family pseudouridine synthase [Deltaproteobacteria bacterium]|nr:RluA family pseudouridine synthase [Deltaproteobacteria bacterium]MBW1952488.1 RluA family pseudouridine synthase [Deltaproteobacteria bacterium]MBW1987339.1 RluA family pseudouridine synthase [Deltaproteobacteria bacterium]MBW2135301.1 RluA family pseudouridine synthase [Deltaproteobacteria bacterium]
MTRVALTVAAAEQGLRLDQILTRHLLNISRARLQKWIKSGLVQVNEASRPADYRVQSGDRLVVEMPAPEKSSLVPEPIPLDILFEDQDLLVINKPPGLVVHPGAGHRTGTLVHAILHHCPNLTGVGDVQRPGLVHRLDKETSGLMIVAKTDLAHQSLVSQFKQRQLSKFYLALVWGHLSEPHGEIVETIGRHPRVRQKMSVHARRGREAHTSWRRLQHYPGPLALVELQLHTGRTHQIRVHLAAIGHPVVGDRTYGGGARRLSSLPAMLSRLKTLVSRQLLHAWKLTLNHPRTGKSLTLEAELPTDFRAVVDFLELHPKCSR